MTRETGDVDFVLTWVDGGDPEWLAEKRKYAPSGSVHGDPDNAADCRYRDGGLLKYWFRAAEKFAPWVRTIVFVTCGQKPDWLDETNPKLKFVSHSDFIPAEYLPTFNSGTIEINLHRIEGLAERFVLFNDDMFLLRPVGPDEFFRNGLPVLECDAGLPRWLGPSLASRMCLNVTGFVSRHFDMERSVWRNWSKWFDPFALGPGRALKNLASVAVNRCVVFGIFGHLALPHLKSAFAELWDAEPQWMARASRDRVRSDDSLVQWLACAWNQAEGRFAPANKNRGRGLYFALSPDSAEVAAKAVREQAAPQICLNDTSRNVDPARAFATLAAAFESILPEKSSFEK